MQKVKTERKEKPKKKKTCSEHVRDRSLSSFRGYGRGSLVSLITEQGIGYGQFLVLLRSHSQGTNSNQVFVSVTLCICDFKFQSRIHGLSLASLNFKVNNIYIYLRMQVLEWNTALDSLSFSFIFSLLAFLYEKLVELFIHLWKRLCFMTLSLLFFYYFYLPSVAASTTLFIISNH